MQTAVGDVPSLTATTDPPLPTSDLVVLALEGTGLLAICFGVPALAASLGGAVLAIVAVAAVIVALIALAWWIGIEFERAWLTSYCTPDLADERAKRPSGVLVESPSLEAREAARGSELAGVGRTGTPAR